MKELYIGGQYSPVCCIFASPIGVVSLLYNQIETLKPVIFGSTFRADYPQTTTNKANIYYDRALLNNNIGRAWRIGTASILWTRDRLIENPSKHFDEMFDLIRNEMRIDIPNSGFGIEDEHGNAAGKIVNKCQPIVKEQSKTLFMINVLNEAEIIDGSAFYYANFG
jgi:hypothetical protein